MLLHRVVLLERSKTVLYSLSKSVTSSLPSIVHDADSGRNVASTFSLIMSKPMRKLSMMVLPSHTQLSSCQLSCGIILCRQQILHGGSSKLHCKYLQLPHPFTSGSDKDCQNSSLSFIRRSIPNIAIHCHNILPVHYKILVLLT